MRIPPKPKIPWRGIILALGFAATGIINAVQDSPTCAVNVRDVNGYSFTIGTCARQTSDAPNGNMANPVVDAMQPRSE